MEHLRKRVSLIILIGLCLVLFGGGVTLLLREEGVLSLNKEETTSAFFDNSGKRKPLGFSIMLKEFEKSYYPSEEEWLLVFIPDKKTSMKLPAKQGASYQIGRAVVKMIKKSSPGDPSAFLVEVTEETGRSRQAWISAEPAEASNRMNEGFTLLYAPQKKFLKTVKSWIEIKEKNGKVLNFLLETVRPLYFRGYRFDPLENDPEGKKQMTFRVKRYFDQVIVYTGLGTVLTGLLFLWYLNPYFLPKEDKIDHRPQGKTNELSAVDH
ncbi:MAG: hypothetical protein HYS56_01180 [Candidatus Omnitrophica bacterium]|nr:hypothetical protein [Candidatus Omnitrophota bacterium]